MNMVKINTNNSTGRFTHKYARKPSADSSSFEQTLNQAQTNTQPTLEADKLPDSLIGVKGLKRPERLVMSDLLHGQGTHSSTSFTPTSARMSKRFEAYKPMIERTAARYGLDPNLVAGLIKQESGFNPNAKSHAGAMGLMQLMPQTARSLGVRDAYNPEQNMDGGARYLRQMLDRFDGNVELALAAYNAGPGNVEKYGNRIPPFQETRHYVKAVTANAHSMQLAGTFVSTGKRLV